MYSSALIVFREVLEAALVISVVMAATKGICGRQRWVLSGVAMGLIGAIIVAAFAEAISMAMDGLGQELFNAGVLFCAVMMLAWHNLWMSRHAKELTQGLQRMGRDVLSGERPLYFIAIAVSLALLREGSEVVLFMYGVAAGGASTLSLLLGGCAGLLAGVAAGAALYWGLVTIPVRYLFAVTAVMINLLAAGMAAQGSAFLAQAGYLPDAQPLWDSSAWLSIDSVGGELLHAFVGYDPRPTAIQITFYLSTLALISVGMWLLSRSDRELISANSQ